MEVDSFHLSALDFSTGTVFSTCVLVFPSARTADAGSACFFRLLTSCSNSALRFCSWLTACSSFCSRSASDGVSAASGGIAASNSNETTTPAGHKKQFLISICFSYFAAPFARPLCDWLPRDPENCFNDSTLLLPRIGGFLSLDKIDVSGMDLSRKGGATLSRPYLRSVILTMSASVKRSSTVLMAFRTSNINIPSPQCTSSGQEQPA